MSELSISNVIRVTVQGVQRSRTPKNVNDVALFTPEVPNSVIESMYVIDPSDVADAFGTDSLTYKMAVNVFAQNANILSGRGGLVIIPMQNTTNAIAATFTTPDINSTAITAFQSINNGCLTISANGSDIVLSGLDFTNISSVADIAAVLQNATSAVSISASGQTIVFGSKKFGSASSVSIIKSDSSEVSGTDIYAVSYLNGAAGSAVSGAESSGETLAQALTRTLGKIAYTGVMCAKYMSDTEVSDASAIVSANDLIFVNVWYSANDILGACYTIQQATQNKTRCLVYTNGFESAKLMMAAYVGRAFSVNFEGSDVSQTMNLKTLANVLPDLNLSQTDYNNAETSGVDLYASYEGDPAVVSNGANGYFDTVYENMALKFHAQVALYNALKVTGTKIPQTEAGVSILKNALATTFRQFVRNGVIAPGTWNSPQTFGDPETFRANIKDQGWYVYSLPIAQQSQAEREARIAPYIQGACKRAGAIHEADVLILVEE